MQIYFPSRNAARTFASNVNARGVAKATVKDNKDSPSANGSRYAVAMNPKEVANG